MHDNVPDDHPDRAYRCEECGADMPLSDCVYAVAGISVPRCPLCGGECWAQEGEMDAWKESTMLVDASGDPDGITPEMNERNINALTQERDAARRLVTLYADTLTMIHAGLPPVGLDDHCDEIRRRIESTRTAARFEAREEGSGEQ